MNQTGEPMEAEQRELRTGGALRAVNGTGKLVGHAIVYNSPSVIITEKGRTFREVVTPGAVRKSLDSGQEIKADVEHEPGRVIGRRSKGTLTLTEDDTGVFVEITPGDDSDGRDARAKVERGDVDQMSFEFSVNPGGEQWQQEGQGVWLRSLTDINLYRVSIVAEPAYPTTSIAARSLEAAEAEQQVREAAKPGAAPDAVPDTAPKGMPADLAAAKLRLRGVKK